ncbi:hypothetical protein [Lentzea albidocapillata]|uniref:Rv0361 family membrane protein n=1 Tax=Lentzea albidocapillata TaxID=40571 RepID=UPI0004C38BC0|nr:hypothetical protein [Lentzea albidocapillata]
MSIDRPGGKPLRRIVLVTAAIVLVVGGTGLYFYIAGRDVREIRTVVDSFVTAVDTADQARVVALLCQEEAAGLTENEDPPVPSPAIADDPSHAREVTEVEVRDDAASAKVVRPDEEPYTLYLRKEADVWKVCAPVEERFTGAPPS